MAKEEKPFRMVTNKIVNPASVQGPSPTPQPTPRPAPSVQIEQVLNILLDQCELLGMQPTDRKAHYDAIHGQLGLPATAQTIATTLAQVFDQGVQGNP